MENTKQKSNDRIIQEMIDITWSEQISATCNLTYKQIEELNNSFSINEGKYTYR
jgi:hypothetical protein